jgi:nucleoside 2-deoxyribosyltransferase
MKFYVATRFSNKAEVRRTAKLLKQEFGHDITYNWANQPLLPVTEKVLRESAVEEIEGVNGADYVVAILPGGYGTHVEIGAALVQDKPVFLVVPNDGLLSDPYKNAVPFYRHPNVHRVQSLEMVPAVVEYIMDIG